MLSQFFPPVVGGQERHVYNLCAALADRGAEVHVATSRVDAGSPLGPQGVSVHEVGTTLGRFGSLFADSARPHALPVPDPVTTHDLARLVRVIDPDVIHGHDWIVASALPHQVKGDRPVVLTLHEYGLVCATKRMMRGDAICSGPGPLKCPPCAARHYGAAKGSLLLGGVVATSRWKRRSIDRFLPVSEAVAERSGCLSLAAEKWEVLPNFIPDELTTLVKSESRPTYLPCGEYLFFAGDLSRQKGFATLLEAYAALPPGKPALLAVGRKTTDVPDVLPVGVEIGSEWPHAQVSAGFQHALAAVLPSEWPDPFPTTVLEAMALGAPLITTAEGGIADMVVPGRSALVVAAGDAAALTAAMSTLIADPDLRRRLQRTAACTVRQFLASNVAERLGGIYGELIGAHSE